ncbi:MAG: PilW family protein [Candidatus Zixiibacteriota bacterium]
MKRLTSTSGFTLTEVLIAGFLAAGLVAVTFQFYIAEHNNMLTQHSVSDLQQNIRAGIADITRSVRNAGANLPNDLQPIIAYDTNPDTLILRYALMGGVVNVGEGTLLQQAFPIHVPLGTDLSQFSIGGRAYIWYDAAKQGEWFTITNMVTNGGLGWEEIHHLGQDLMFNPQAGDFIINLQESQYFVNNADTAAPLLMREQNGDTAMVYAENVYDLQFQFQLSDSSTVNAPTAADTVYLVNVSMSAQAAEIDYNLEDRGLDGRRRRTLSTTMVVRNNRF